ncbi:DUF2344 domain-containing protein|uniref:Radical SAM-linked protein n=1 Tax=Dendrosporobacter quercicolus TaxID=146817 RepID=A0A1G9N204_9FIRM|nr:TIGR03936 family radical SAM-associated protein [Dendrosporobacter quercicolus]NSL47191.1 DUF2344 domain-containing protein [Dendrosporobacter quercicolus DSM 1736]SDL79885.1 radical SAM-linked protein [Dendrosporobacter quercicolus]
MGKLRAEITKGEEIRYISHLDYARAIERAIRRAHLPVAYSEGFNPHMKIAFASALAVGVTSEAEYLDIEMKEAVEPDLLRQRLLTHLPPGIELKQVKYLQQQKQRALMALADLARYTIAVPLCGSSFAAAQSAIASFNQAVEVRYIRESPKGKKEVDVKDYLKQDIIAMPDKDLLILHMAIEITPSGSIKPGEVLRALVDQFDLAVKEAGALIHRTGLFTTALTARISLFDA